MSTRNTSAGGQHPQVLVKEWTFYYLTKYHSHEKENLFWQESSTVQSTVCRITSQTLSEMLVQTRWLQLMSRDVAGISYLQQMQENSSEIIIKVTANLGS
ncbi:hypothetical protein V1264_006453 [Littorina saxatilis]|uniref:Uncharacterized protein n=1 Tax=Littorina saxatilis TaxID=31220 RepID=A0AAN9G4A1_9CAEN